MKLAIAVCSLSLALCGWASAVSAHHAFAAEFDANKPVNFKGTITKMEWVNPHTWLHISVKNPNGTMENWAIEAGTPNVLFPAASPRNRCCRAPRSWSTATARKTAHAAPMAAI